MVPDRFDGHHMTGVRQERWDRLEPHPTDMPILNDAGVAAYPPEMITDRLARERIILSGLLTGQTFGAYRDCSRRRGACEVIFSRRPATAGAWQAAHTPAEALNSATLR